MTLQYVKKARNVQKSSSGTRSQPLLRRGQVVLGIVQRHLSSGLVQTRILNHLFIASTNLPVSVGDKLLMHVLEAEPKPHLQVISSPSATASSISDFPELNSLQNLLERGFPLSLKSLQNGLFAGGLSPKEFAKLISENPGFWQKVFWNLSPASHSDILRIFNWYQEGQNLFNGSNLQKLNSDYLQQNFQFSALQTDLKLAELQIYNPINDGKGSFGNLLNVHAASIHFMNSLVWEYGIWSGLFFPFSMKNQCGLAALSYWQPEIGEENMPRRFSLIAGFNNGWILHVLFDYRKSDVAGNIEVNSRKCEVAVNEFLPDLIADLNLKGFKHTGIRVNYIPKLNIDYSKLLPPVNQSQTYAG